MTQCLVRVHYILSCYSNFSLCVISLSCKRRVSRGALKPFAPSSGPRLTAPVWAAVAGWVRAGSFVRRLCQLINRRKVSINYYFGRWEALDLGLCQFSNLVFLGVDDLLFCNFSFLTWVFDGTMERSVKAIEFYLD